MKNVVFNWHRWIPVVAMMLLGTGVFAQPRFGFRNDSTINAMRDRSGRLGLNLTDEQQEQIAALREANQQELTDIFTAAGFPDTINHNKTKKRR